jgi:hypothetical protein
MDVPGTELGPLAVAELVEKKQRMIADALEVFRLRRISRSFLPAMYRTLGAVHVQDDAPVSGAGHPLLHPPGVEVCESPQVLRAGQHLGLKAAHAVGAGRRLVGPPPARDDAHGRVLR